MIRIRWPVALATLFLIVFGWYLVYTQLLQDGLRENQALMSEVFAIAQELIQDTSRSERLVGGRLQDVPLFDLQEVMIRSRIPMIIISPAESVVSVENLPFEADILTPEGQEEVQAYVSRIEATGQEPVRGAGEPLIYLGDPPQLSNLRWIPWLQASGLTLTALCLLYTSDAADE